MLDYMLDYVLDHMIIGLMTTALYLNSSLFKDRAAIGAVAGARVEACNTMEVGVGVPLPSVGATPANSSLPVGEKL